MAADLLQTGFARAPRYTALVQGWLADLYLTLGNPSAAAQARADCLRQWREIAARTDLPKDVLAQARQELANPR
ncbi:MAG: hypothetical protein JNK48_19210 [Bryobacterales bacterium]|nr:hypothetical protein [Bryobacterales bacterium]